VEQPDSSGIEEFVKRAPPHLRTAVLTSLLKIDFHYRERAGETIHASDYIERFPNDGESIAEAFSQYHRDKSAVDVASSDDYEILEPIGRGGMGVIYKARDKLGRIVALKSVRSACIDGDSIALERFRREIKAASQLEHDHIARVYDSGNLNGQPYYTMQFIDGQSLQELLRDDHQIVRPLLGRVAARYMAQVGDAIHYAHQKEIPHRDLKPGNVLVDKEDRAYITDFGLARMDGDLQTLTGAGNIVGTPGYMAPEQIEGNPQRPATDIYGLGATPR
jgi:serine/threonine protein kinase